MKQRHYKKKKRKERVVNVLDLCLRPFESFYVLTTGEIPLQKKIFYTHDPLAKTL